MIIQRINRTNADKAFIVIRNSESSAMVKGSPAALAWSGTRDGIDVIYADAAIDAHSVIGLVDTAIPAGSYGLAQCYGIRTDAVMIKSGSATDGNAVVGDVMILDTTITGLSAAAVGAVSAYLAQAVCGATFASSSVAGGTTAATVFLRMM